MLHTAYCLSLYSIWPKLVRSKAKPSLFKLWFWDWEKLMNRISVFTIQIQSVLIRWRGNQDVHSIDNNGGKWFQNKISSLVILPSLSLLPHLFWGESLGTRLNFTWCSVYVELCTVDQEIFETRKNFLCENFPIYGMWKYANVSRCKWPWLISSTKTRKLEKTGN